MSARPTSVLTSLLLVTIAALIQASLMWRFSVIGVSPNLFIVVLASIALLTGSITGALCGFTGGVFLACFGAFPLGAHAMIATLIGYAIGRVSEHLITDEHPAPPLIAAIFATFTMGIGRPILEFLVNPAAHDVEGMWRAIIVSTTISCVLALPVYIVVRKLLMFFDSLVSRSDEVSV